MTKSQGVAGRRAARALRSSGQVSPRSSWKVPRTAFLSAGRWSQKGGAIWPAAGDAAHVGAERSGVERVCEEGLPGRFRKPAIADRWPPDLWPAFLEKGCLVPAAVSCFGALQPGGRSVRATRNPVIGPYVSAAAASILSLSRNRASSCHDPPLRPLRLQVSSRQSSVHSATFPCIS